MDIVFLLVGLVIGFALAFFFLKSKGENALGMANEKARLLEANTAELKNELRLLAEASESKLKQERQAAENRLADERAKADAKFAEERRKTDALQPQLATAISENESLRQKLAEQKGELEQLNQKFTKEFENLANRILDEKSQKFTEQNRNNLDIILNPFKEKLKDFEQKVDMAYKAESTERTTLRTEIKLLVDLNKQISEEANNLATALKGDNKQQGNWGEMVLEKILERSGLVEGTEYKTQLTDVNVEGDRIKPDVVIFLPDNKHVIVDSKVSLVAYNSCVNAVTDEDRARFLKGHIDSLRSHVKLLSDKGYQTASGLSTPDFVLLFVPIESSFSLAVQGDAELFNFAWDRKIVIVSPSTLLATLRTIASIWKQERQTRNALEIAEEGGRLYDKFVGFYEDLVKVGKKMDDAKGDYVEAMKKLYEGTGNLVRRAEKMKDLGAKTTKQLPQALIDRANQ
ncbi:MAG TPA: DNA recombination protein RmuC [Chitinophagales bacterium]|nr:DNA recombination protein RmuC [Chitinophagales bacterium]